MASAAALGSHLSGGRINLAQVREAARSDLRDCLVNCPHNKVKHSTPTYCTCTTVRTYRYSG